MSNSLSTVANLRAAIPPVSEWLKNPAQYHAHTPRDTKGQNPEPLEAHIELVDDYFSKLCEVHQLDPVIDNLVLGIVDTSFPEITDRATLAELIKQAFVWAIHFHDFGKVNVNFQAERMRNPLFKAQPSSPLGSKHSALGAYLFITKRLQEHSAVQLSANDAWALDFINVLLAYPIFKHHSSRLSCPMDGDISISPEELAAMRVYLSNYQFEITENLSDDFFKNLNNNFFTEFECLNIGFPLFTLLKLNFSLLTAADYLATHHYMTGEHTTDLGVFSGRARVEEIVHHLRSSQSYNQSVYAKLENYQFAAPTLKEKSKANLNRLREEMAVSLILTIRQHTNERLFYIEAPTGGGKTNLSMIALTELLAANLEINKVFYVFPYTTLITQTYNALKETLKLKENELVELHAKASLHSKNSNKEQQQSNQELEVDADYGPSKKDYIDNLFALYPLTVLSHVRFFEALKTNGKEANYLLHRLANSVVVIDELQSYNPKTWDKMLYLIQNYAQYFNIKFVLMSATLPKISELKLPGFDNPEFINLLPQARAYMTNPNFAQRVEFNFSLLDEKKISLEALAEVVITKSEAFAKVSEHESVHTIVEFIYKKTASDFGQLFLDAEKGLSHLFEEVLILSGTLLDARRKEIIGKLKSKTNRSKNILLITTQVVEAGVDIDMDLGFKNISLIDSDEQLAGRVNRNASKKNCEVYLFRLNDPAVLYGKDDRYNVRIEREEHEEILREKDFARLYDLVFSRIDQTNTKNASGYADNFKNGFLSEISRLNFPKVDRSFQIIDQDNASVFVPLHLPIKLEYAEVFSEAELNFLHKLDGWSKDESMIDGRKVWDIYVAAITQKGETFDLGEVIKFNTLQRIMAKFTFSLFAQSRVVRDLREFCGHEDDGYGYMYLAHYAQVYSFDEGLIANKFTATENQFL